MREGQVLFQIDPVPLEAVLGSAKAAVAKAEAALSEFRARMGRYEGLVKINAISKQVYEESAATLGRNEADLLGANASLRTAELNLGYAQVTAPISGRIGKALVTEGALVSAVEATELAVIRQLDPVYFDFTQTSAEVLFLKRALADGTVQDVPAGEAGVTLILEDGIVYSHAGERVFSDVAVDPTTGMVALRARFQNPEHLLIAWVVPILIMTPPKSRCRTRCGLRRRVWRKPCSSKAWWSPKPRGIS